MESFGLNKTVLCQLERDLRIAVKGECYILQERVYDTQIDAPEKYIWKDKFYYGWIAGALRGYVLYSLQRFARTDPSDLAKRLIEQIESLDTTISQIGIGLAKMRKGTIDDPIEFAINKAITNDPIEVAIRGYKHVELGEVNG